VSCRIIQQADKAVRYRQLPPEAESIRLALAKSSAAAVEDGITREQDPVLLSRRNAVTLRMARLLDLNPDQPEARLSDALLSTNELADVTGFAPKTVRRWAARKLLNFIRVGNQFRFRPAAVELFLSQREIRK
jgi:excisionase family DNA binding protein